MAEEVFSNPLLSDMIIKSLGDKQLCTLACVCKLLKKLAYNPKWWPSVDLPFPGSPSTGPMLYFTAYLGSPKIAIYSTMRPPKDPLALEKLLQAMLPSKSRFVNTTSVQFKNYMFSDKAVLLTSQIFPSLERLNLDGGRITSAGIKYVKDFRKLRFLGVHCNDQFNWNPKDWLKPLESHLERLAMRGKINSLFLKKCAQCHLWYNPKFNSTTSCLYHPEEYSGYGHSCSSFQCCGSNTPCYMGTPGCTYLFPSFGKSVYRAEDWLPEFIDVPYGRGVDLYGCNYLSERRDPDSVE